MPSANKINRRRFLARVGQTAGGIALPMFIPSGVAIGQAVPANRITLGFIGVGMQGGGLLWDFLDKPDCRVVAVCDVDSQKAENARAMVERRYGRGCDVCGDFRQVLARSDIDAVVIAVPDHWHAAMVGLACQAGKDIYCEKPLSLTIGQARQMVTAVRRHGRVFQAGSMQRSDSRFRHACELVRNGYIGKVKTVAVNINVSEFPMHSHRCDLPAEPLPDNLDWNMWLGPAPYRPYHSVLAPPAGIERWAHWRDYDDYSGGMMTDWGAHHFDIAQWGLGMDDSGPVEICPPGGRDFRMLTYKYADGTILVRDDSMKKRSIVFTGTDGVVEVSRDMIRTVPKYLVREAVGPDNIRLYKSDDHYADFLRCIRSRTKPICDVEIGCRSVTVCHLGNVANQLARPLKWDAAREMFVGDDQANRLLNRPMRSPWHL